MEADGYELVTLQHHRHDLIPVSVSQDWGRGVVIWLAGFSLPGVQHLGWVIDETQEHRTTLGTWNILGMSLASARMTSP